jgi:dihydroflavonol-4-reductase
MQAKKALVTGGTGFLGLNLIEHLTELGWETTVLHRAKSNVSYVSKYPVRLVQGSIEDAHSLQNAVPANLDAIFHVAADTSMWPGNLERQWRTNVIGTRNMLEIALMKGTRKFVHTSTSGVYGLAREPFDESAPKLGKGSFNYQHSKTVAEEEVQHAVGRELDAVIINPANIIGRYDWHSWTTFIRKVAQREMPLVPKGSACFCDAGSVSRAHVAAVDKGRTGENYLLGGEQASYADLVRLTCELLGIPLRSRNCASPVFRMAGRTLDRLSTLTKKEPILTAETAALLTSHIICRSDKSERELGYHPTSLRAMLKDCLDWMIGEGIITRESGANLSDR